MGINELQTYRFSSMEGAEKVGITEIIQQDSLIGIFSFSLILILWLSSAIFFLSFPLSQFSLPVILLGILFRTFLYTGLFILGHDAMHFNLVPANRQINSLLGTIAVSLYAFLSYSQCCINHRKHHRQTSQVGDPDFHDGVHIDPLHWYLKFIGEYISYRQIIIFFIIWCGLELYLIQFRGVHWLSLVLFGIFPFILSSIQLFIFGTFLPHRNPLDNSDTLKPINPLQTRRQSWIKWVWSFLTCFHFGMYHKEHHQNPKTPWYRLTMPLKTIKRYN